MMKLLAALLFGLMISSVPILASHADESRIIVKLDDLVETAAQKELRQARKLEQQRQAERIANKSTDAVTVKKVVAPTPPPAPNVIPPRIEDRLLPARPQKVESPLSAEKKALLEKVTGGRAPKQIQLAPKVPVTTKATFLSPGEFKALPPNGYIDPKRIRFSQNSMGNTFQPPYGKIDDLTTKLRSQSVLPGSVEPIRIVQKDNMIFSLDNRRLYAYQQADVQVPYKKLDTVPVRENYKFSTKTNGESITIRKGKQRD